MLKQNQRGVAGAVEILIIIVVIAIIGALGYWVYDSNRDDDDNDTDTSEVTEAPAEQNIVELAQATDDLSTLADAVVAADLVETLSDEDAEFTVFAPNNAAFDALPDGTLDDLLLPENQDDLVDVLTFHVVEGEVFAEDLEDGMMLTTVQGGVLEVSIADDGTVTVGEATVVTADVDASNGVVHVIDAVLLP